MRTRHQYLSALLCFLIISAYSFSQNIVVSGNIQTTTTKEFIPAVSVQVKGTSTGTFSDDRGKFRINISKALPVTLMFTSIGYEPKEVVVSSLATDALIVELVPGSSLGSEVVVSASRVPQKILESPVSIERVSAANIRNTPATGYYDILKQLKGVDMVYSSLTFGSPSTRGFAGSGNARVNQLVDGMDNQAPGLNFSVGSVVGVTELDVDNMELLPGASSALYGAGGMNGTILINSKDPFKYQGLSFQVKTGIMHVDKKQRDKPGAYHDWSLRWAEKVSDKFAFKIGAQFIQAKDWVAMDRTNYLAGDASLSQYGNVKPGDRISDPNYDGVNVYGDETSLNLTDASTPFLGLVSNAIKGNFAGTPFEGAVNAFMDSTVGSYNAFRVSRTGYDERDVVNNNTVNVKLSGGLYYKLTNQIEASLVGYWGTGNTVYTGSDRYSLEKLKIGQYKLELKHKNWFVRAYTTQENSGDSYSATITTRIFNEAWKESSVWYQQYTQNFLVSKLTPYVTALSGGPAYVAVADGTAHNLGRTAADVDRPAAGSELFNQLFDQVASKPISDGGGLFLDKTDLYYGEGQYNFGNILNIAELLTGANYKRYVLNSQGTLFADTSGNIGINEVGAYAQLSRRLFNEKLSLTASGRYDKNQNFKGRFTPRFTAVFKLADDHNIRASYQTAYRFPTTQNQWINLAVGGGVVLIGGLPQLRDFYGLNTNKGYSLQSVQAVGAAIGGGVAPQDALQLLQENVFDEYKPETLKSYELGYKGLIQKKLLIDIYGYYGKYDNFLGRTVVLQSLVPGNPGGVLSSSTRRAISVAVNSKEKVITYGFGAGVDYLLPNNFVANGNISADRIEDVDEGFVSFFNAPSYRLVLGFGNTAFGHHNRFGFNINLRNQDGFYYENDFRQGEIDGFTTIDAQVSYKFPSTRSLLKLGGTNISNKYYQTAFGNPEIGAIYYVSFGYNVF